MSARINLLYLMGETGTMNACRITEWYKCNLEMRRLRADLIQVYEILHGIDDIPRETLFQKSESTQTRGHNLKLYKKHSRFDLRKFSHKESSPNGMLSPLK